jgi:hypothetical protein
MPLAVKYHGLSGIRIKAEAEKDDFYPTPPQATRALLEHENFSGPVWEPACGDGAISKVLIDEDYDVISTDLVDRGYGTPRIDFLMETRPYQGHAGRPKSIVTNPPFKLATHFLIKARYLVPEKIAMLLPVKALGGGNRGKFFAKHLSRVLVVPRRLCQIKRGGWDGGKGGGSMIDFAWFILDPPTAGECKVMWPFGTEDS